MERIAYRNVSYATIVVAEIDTGAVLATLTELVELNRGNDAALVSLTNQPRFSPDGSRLAASIWSSAAAAWDTETWTSTTLRVGLVDVNSSGAPCGMRADV